MNAAPLPRIGIIGLGTAGSAAARKLLAAAPPELALTVFDKAPEQCEPFRGAATLAASTNEALHESDLVLLALPGQREIDRTLERFSDGQVSADIRGKLLWNLCVLPGDAAAGLRSAVETAGAVYVAEPADQAVAMRVLQQRFDAAAARAVLRAMRAV
ncbi:MAG TPA: NAD(P)-binding domain-containing protein [Bordetella sp.]|nr:NAD(P)-binding domain-containing protein [Bordetella sp.]